MKTSPPSKRLCMRRAAKRSLLGYGGNSSSLKHVFACQPQRVSTPRPYHKSLQRRGRLASTPSQGKRGQERAREGKRGQKPTGNLGQARNVIDPDDLKALGPVGSIQSCPLCYVSAVCRSTAALAARTPLASAATPDPVTTGAGMVKRHMERERQRERHGRDAHGETTNQTW
jgi:hypothetical protein